MASSFAFAVCFLTSVFSSVVKSLLPSISWSFVVLAASTALIASAFLVPVAVTLLISPIPFVLACSTRAFVVAVSTALRAAVSFSVTFCLAVVFSSSVKPACLSISPLLVFAACLIASFASSFLVPVAVTLLISPIPFVLACSTRAFVVAVSTALRAAVSFSVTFCLAVVFSSSVKPACLSISPLLVFAACLIASFASAFFAFLGKVTFPMLVTPLFLALFKAVSSWALSIFRIASFFAVSANPMTSTFSSFVKEVSLFTWSDLFVNAVFTSFFAPSLFNVGVGALGIVTPSLRSDSTSFIVNVFPYASVGAIPALAIFFTVMTSLTFNGAVGVHVAIPFEATTVDCSLPLR